jgi:hypothetical protein
MAFYVFDLDGTLADLTHRLHFIQGETKDWRGFFAACGGDKPMMLMVDLFQALNYAWERHRVEIWSGRSDEVRGETEAWLLRYDLFPRALLMRTAGDYRPDDEVKREFLRGGAPDMIFDDRKRVVDMWRREGIQCCHVADGEF